VHLRYQQFKCTTTENFEMFNVHELRHCIHQTAKTLYPRIRACSGFCQACMSRRNHGVCVPSAVTIARTDTRTDTQLDTSCLDTHCACVPSAVVTSMAEDTNKNNTPWDRMKECQNYNTMT